MGSKDPRVDTYIAKSADFAKPILKHLRKSCTPAARKWRRRSSGQHPHFDYKGVMCGMAAFKEHCVFGFWKEALILYLNKIAEKTAMGSFGCLRLATICPPTRRLIGYVKKAGVLNEAGIKAPGRTQPKKKEPLPVPDYFSAALKKNARARKTFEDFPPSKRREYLEWVIEAKREETRRERLATSIEWLAQGKPRHWKYMPAKK